MRGSAFPGFLDSFRASPEIQFGSMFRISGLREQRALYAK
jgi:hypothetical protein